MIRDLFIKIWEPIQIDRWPKEASSTMKPFIERDTILLNLIEEIELVFTQLKHKIDLRSEESLAQQLQAAHDDRARLAQILEETLSKNSTSESRDQIIK